MKALFVFGVFEQISLLGFQWADAVQHLNQYSRHNSHGCTNIWCFRARQGVLWCWAQICISSCLISVPRSLSPIRWCLKVMLSSPWDGSGVWVRNVNWGFNQQQFKYRNGRAAAGVEVTWEAPDLNTLHSLCMIHGVTAHQATSWTIPQEGCEETLLGFLALKTKDGRMWQAGS